jgi:hypothetical protein
MIRQFWFRKLDVGYFTDDDWPRAAGLYPYKPLVAPQIPRDMWLGKPDSPGPSGHAAMQNALALGETPVCYYYTGDSRVFFTVRECPEAGVLSLSDFETEAWLLPTTIAQQLGGIYHELVDKKPFSEIARVPLAQASASGRALRLVIWQCDAEVLFLAGVSRRWWVADASGLHPDGEWPLSDELLNSERGASENPRIKFATDRQRVRFGMSLGMTKPGRYWYASCEAPLGPDGRFIPDQLVVDRSASA